MLFRGQPVGSVLADEFRADLLAAGLGNGRHGFTYTLPRKFSGPATLDAIQVVVEGTTQPLATSSSVRAAEAVPVPQPPVQAPVSAPTTPRAAPAPHFVGHYRKLVGELLSQHPLDEAMSRAVGGLFKQMGDIEKQLLLQLGLKPEHTIVDVGCGSGRLACALADYLTPQGHYVGTDVVPELLAYAKARTPGTWEYYVNTNLTIPSADASADFICFFSVFTHLQQTESYCYLLEARRVLKPGGTIVFSFLELPDNWAVFEQTVTAVRTGTLPHLNEFVGREAVRVWAEHLELNVLHIRGANEPFVEMPTEPGSAITHKVPFGQAVCTLQKPLREDSAPVARVGAPPPAA